MEILCPTCSTPAAAEDVNVQALLARCLRCNAVFSFAEQVVPIQPTVPTRAPVPRPQSIQLSSTGEVLTMSRRWFNLGAIFLTFFCVFWDGFLVFWYAMALSRKNIELMAVLFPMLHLAAGVFITYLTASLYVNSTILTVTRRDLSIKHTPLPWPGNRTLPLSDVDQFYSEEIRGSKGSRSYTLSVLLKNGSKLRLLGGLDDAGTALYLEQQLEQWFGIQDRPVGDELRR